MGETQSRARLHCPCPPPPPPAVMILSDGGDTFGVAKQFSYMYYKYILMFFLCCSFTMGDSDDEFNRRRRDKFRRERDDFDRRDDRGRERGQFEERLLLSLIYTYSHMHIHTHVYTLITQILYVCCVIFCAVLNKIQILYVSIFVLLFFSVFPSCEILLHVFI